MCAFGRVLVEPERFGKDNITAKGLLNNHGDDIISPEYQGHEFDFWSMLQDLHDRGHTDSSKVINDDLVDMWMKGWNVDLTKHRKHEKN